MACSRVTRGTGQDAAERAEGWCWRGGAEEEPEGDGMSFQGRIANHQSPWPRSAYPREILYLMVLGKAAMDRT